MHERREKIYRIIHLFNNSIVKLCQMYYFCSASNGKTNWEKHNSKPNYCKEIRLSPPSKRDYCQ